MKHIYIDDMSEEYAKLMDEDKLFDNCESAYDFWYIFYHDLEYEVASVWVTPKNTHYYAIVKAVSGEII